MATTRLAVPAGRRGGRADVQFPGRGAVPGQSEEGRLLDTMSETHAAMMDAVLDGDGLEAVAELAAAAGGGPVAVLIPRLGVALAPGGATPGDLARLERWVEERVRGRPSAVPDEVVAEAPIRFRDEIVGVVALLRTEEAPRAEACEFLRLAGAAALTALAIEDAKEETEQNLRGSFLEELRSRSDLTGPEIVRRAARLRCDLSGGGVILCAELDVDRPRLVGATISAEHPGALAQALDGDGANGRPRVYAALPAVGAGDDVADTSVASARKLAGRLQRYGTVAISSFHADPAELACAVREAELVLEVLQHSGTAITDEIGSCTYKLLFRVLASHPEEVREYYENTVAPMVRYDGRNQTELVHTLRAYLDANCNMNATAAAIFTHRHTIMHRLERIRELTGLDPTLCADREQLGLGLKVHRLLAPALAR